uniref:Uncharacterized protein n=1 Tax=Myoviridae sp. ctbEa13 TaxID=2825136 RepID=A0A8S5VBI1_9CAUD|nr:MAG TPA: hypothetical protein [Myoviridae sp. ctbEa13]
MKVNTFMVILNKIDSFLTICINSMLNFQFLNSFTPLRRSFLKPS